MSNATPNQPAGLAGALNVHLTQETNTDAAWRRYRELLTDDVGDDQQVEEIKRLMPPLNKTVQDVVRDQQTIAEAKRLRAVIRAGRDLRQDIEAAAKAAEDKAAEARQIQQRIMGELVAAREENARLQGRQDDARAACGALAELKAANPELLADVEAVKPEEL